MNKNDSDDPDRLSKMHPEKPDAGGSDLLRLLLGGAIVVALGVIIFVIYTIHHKDYLTAQANSFARTFISSSPVIEGQLGEVQRVEKLKEQHQTGNASGWYLDYDVTGQHADGVVDMRLQQNAKAAGWNVPVQWNVPSANLEVNHKSLNLLEGHQPAGDPGK